MPDPSWTYSDWNTAYASGTAARLAQLNLHIKEVSDKISTGSFTSEKKSHDFGYLQQYLSELNGFRKEEEALSGVSSGSQNRVSFTRMRFQ